MQVNYTNSARLMCVIGDPIGHSLSPLLQNTMLDYLKEDALYLAIPVKAGGLQDFVAAAKTIGITGFNLTMPHKEDILPMLSSLTPEAAACQSVNTVRIRDGQLEGHSTDGMGFRRSIQTLGWDFPGNTVTILGAGGAAKSVAITAKNAGAKQVRVVNRTLSRGQALCHGQPGMTAYSMSQLSQLLPDTDILINATPMGMAGTSVGSIPDLSSLAKHALCMDCIYAPPVTPFMQAATRHGHTAGNGMGMLVYQAIYAMEFFLDTQFPTELVDALGARLMEVSGIDFLG